MREGEGKGEGERERERKRERERERYFSQQRWLICWKRDARGSHRGAGGVSTSKG